MALAACGRLDPERRLLSHYRASDHVAISSGGSDFSSLASTCALCCADLPTANSIRSVKTASMSKLTVNISDELLQRLRLVAVKERKTLSEIVRGLVESYVRAKETP